ncbi:hypothetical protein [Saccharothrix obliqua]|uniref:hypothetical protein n=1 Tax=Saccharothrix obliqua TaxID=2861747 RepID=UPI001C5E2281|nr:hypothetical protein [Saccharothrix obliqua]MBW4721327.1 hypothetical protein [Saccharothrix obliqua]
MRRPERAGRQESSTLTRRLETFAGIAAPTTVLTALLFYFGYVATYARYQHFGIDLTVLDLTTAEMLLLGTEVLFPPLAGLVVVTVTGWAAHRGLSRAMSGKHPAIARVLAVVVAVAGAASFARGVVGVLWPAMARYEFPGTTPITFGFGLPLVAYGVWLLRSISPPGRRRRRRGQGVVRAALAGSVVLGLFWATNAFAGAYGRGRAVDTASELVTRPGVVLDTEERLYLAVPGVTETVLPAADGQKFKYRYRGLHLLTEAGGRLYLVPATWSGRAATVVKPYDGSVRVQFLPGPPT